MCCIPTFIDVIDLLVKASFPQGWHPHLGKKKKKKAEGSNARGVCVLSVVEKCVCKLEQPRTYESTNLQKNLDFQ